MLYVNKCVKPIRIFLNRILQLLWDNFYNTKILFTTEFFKDLSWFNEFISQYIGVTFYDQKFSGISIHLDVLFIDIDGHFGSMVYSLPIPIGFMNYTIVLWNLEHSCDYKNLGYPCVQPKDTDFFVTIWPW